MHGITVVQGPEGSVLVLMCLDTDQAHLLLVGARGMTDEVYAKTWDEAIRFCWGAGWEPRHDDADLYVASIDTEFYRLIEVDTELDEEVDDDNDTSAMRG